MKYLLIYLIVINVAAFLAMMTDKHKARRDKWRISEKSLFMLALAGGSVGSILGMKLFHHKTRHRLFTIGMPAILLVQLVLYCLFFMKGRYTK